MAISTNPRSRPRLGALPAVSCARGGGWTVSVVGRVGSGGCGEAVPGKKAGAGARRIGKVCLLLRCSRAGEVVTFAGARVCVCLPKLYLMSMRKLVVALMTCAALSGACSRDDAGGADSAGPEGLALVFANDSSGVAVTRGPVTVFDLRLGEEGFVWAVPQFFKEGEAVVLEDADAGERHVLALSGLAEGVARNVYMDSVNIWLAGEMSVSGEGARDVFCGLKDISAAGTEETLRMRRMSGGLVFNVLNVPEGDWEVTVELEREWLAPFEVEGRLIDMNDFYQTLDRMEAGKTVYMLPLSAPLSGMVYLTDGAETREFPFELDRAMEANHVLSVDVTLRPAGGAARSAGAGTAEVTRAELVEM